ncbi:hypothetical protein FB45DRAFT_1110374 [Roridomyces roridus]|uniref:Uncharacterized protein n=1 Tax=Roridomyces roridus TaxID=1738132 RepID=A0AAD7B9C3_9AGAR|nr:hypothetical protein FB45DRAFT_1110374 [Roridomyces roridus]
MSLHVALVAIQLTLVVVWLQGWEHQIVFSVDRELRVARLVKGILTTFITLYSALLVFITQSLALRCDLHRNQLLTATHDNAVAWSGLGSAVVRLWQQRVIPASTIGVLSALTYLVGISILHTAFPGIAAPQSFLVNASVPISTRSLPAFDFSGIDEDNRQSFWNTAGQYAGASLAFLPFLTPSNTLGLYEATLYDVLGPNAGTGSVLVNATGFNITCGYIPDTAYNATTQTIHVDGTEYFLGLFVLYRLSSSKLSESILVPYMTPASGLTPIVFPSPAVFYTSIPVLDSYNNTAPWINITGGVDDFDAAIQAFRCSLTLIEQAVLVDSQSHNFTSFASEPPVEKQTSTWLPFAGHLDDLSTAAFENGARGFLDIWEGWYFTSPVSQPPPLVSSNSTYVGLAVADMALLQQLELYPFNTTLRTSVYLHDVENQLAKIVASMFWTLGHVPAPSGYINSSRPFNVSLLTGQAIVSEPLIQNRLALNIISIVECLVVSLVLLGLSFRFSRLGRREAGATKIDGLDVLQIIWLYRDHPELAAILEQVQIPTDVNLRRAGMFRVQLIDGIAPMREVSDSWVADSWESEKISEDADTLSEPTSASDKPSKERERLGPRWTSDLILSLLSTILHSALVIIHLLLAVVCGMGLEHRITFSLTQQSFVAWLISTFATAFITIYTAGLVFLTQSLSTRRSLRKTQMLNVTHDTVAAWRGIGSALTSVFHRTPSISAVAPAFLYLTGILALHISSPALLTVQTFNSTVPVPVTTQGIPTFTFSGYELSSAEASIDLEHSPLLYGAGTLSYLPFVDSNAATLGLEAGMLYDILNTSTSGPGTATVDAVQLNMTCGYFADPVVNSTASMITILGSDYGLGYTDIGIISTLRGPWDTNSDGLPASVEADDMPGMMLFYSTVPIYDSAGNTGPLINISGMRFRVPGDVANIQIFGCSLGLLNGSVTVSSQSQVLSSTGAFQKDSSVWSLFQEIGLGDRVSTDPFDALVNDWASWYSAMPLSNSPQLVDGQDSLRTIDEMFFIERFNLNSTESSVTLHQFEDALAELVAAMYWTLGHVPPLPGFIPTSLEVDGPPPVEVSLLQGNTVLFADTFEARLDANMSFIILGAVVSGVLLALSLQFSAFRQTTDEEIIGGMGPLHIIWLYRNHPELETELEQVVNPTSSNLRQAAMVQTRLAGPEMDRFIGY